MIPDFTRESAFSQLPGDKFDSKMSHDQRCFALAAFLKGDSWRVIAAYFKVHYRTVQMLKTGPRYKTVRNELGNLGQEAFFDKYLTDEALADYVKWKNENNEFLSTIYQSDDPDAPSFRPNKAARAQSGTHKKKAVFDNAEVVFDIMWRERRANERVGWYAVHGDSMLGPYGTSTVAYDAARVWWNPETIAVTAPAAPAPATREQELWTKRETMIANGKAARGEMNANPSAKTVEDFVVTFINFDWLCSEIDGEKPRPAQDIIKDIDWQGFDPEPFAVHINNHLVKDYNK